nr:hypothetical protein [Tanacetum cinerariifolium]
PGRLTPSGWCDPITGVVVTASLVNRDAVSTVCENEIFVFDEKFPALDSIPKLEVTHPYVTSPSLSVPVRVKFPSHDPIVHHSGHDIKRRVEFNVSFLDMHIPNVASYLKESLCSLSIAWKISNKPSLNTHPHVPMKWENIKISLPSFTILLGGNNRAKNQARSFPIFTVKVKWVALVSSDFKRCTSSGIGTSSISCLGGEADFYLEELEGTSHVSKSLLEEVEEDLG